MVPHNLTSPPAEIMPGAKSTSTSNSVKSTSRVSKRATASAAAIHYHDHVTHSGAIDGRQKRVWKACERCRMKKTKCDGEVPCKRCKDDGLVCTAGVCKRVENKQRPRGYAEVLENTQVALVATIYKLYHMVRNSQPWELSEPNVNDLGLPVIHDIAQKLRTIRPNSDIELPVRSVFPEDDAGMAELARQLEEQQHKDRGDSQNDRKETNSPNYQRNDRATSSELGLSDFEDFHLAAFGSASANTLSPQGFAACNGLEFSRFGPAVPEMDPTAIFTSQGELMPNSSSWIMPRPQTSGISMKLLQHVEALQTANMAAQAVVDSKISSLKPDIPSCANPDIMMSMADPMICSGFDDEVMRL